LNSSPAGNPAVVQSESIERPILPTSSAPTLSPPVATLVEKLDFDARQQIAQAEFVALLGRWVCRETEKVCSSVITSCS
jgi:hypothetical protein